MKRTLKDYFFIGLKGMAMGAADVVPGVSGGTIAFISGIYEELLGSISNINFGLLKTLQKEGLVTAWKQLNGNFLASLFLGIIISVISLAKAIKWLLENEPILLWSFFFGLVLASIIYIAKQVTKWNLISYILLIIGTIFGYLITVIPSSAGLEFNYLFLIFAGAIASCAMILPGISGSYILLLLGVYSTIMTALTEKDFKVISVFIVGIILGLLSFSKLLKYLFANYKNQMLVFLTGLMLGSLNKVWPWKETISTYIDRHGATKPLLQKSILPSSYDGNPEILMAIVLMLVGFSLILLLEKLAVNKN